MTIYCRYCPVTLDGLAEYEAHSRSLHDFRPIPDCSVCGKPVTQHDRVTAEHVAASAGASPAHPLGIRTRTDPLTVMVVLVPLAPSRIGGYWSHVPQPMRP